MAGSVSLARDRHRLGLRGKLMLAVALPVCIPLAVVWSIGVYEHFLRRADAKQVQRSARALLDELGGAPRSAAEMLHDAALLHRFGRQYHVMIRVINHEGNVLHHTSPVYAERWSNIQGWFRRTGDFFFGPAGPPDLLAYEASLPPEGEREEVRLALGGRAAATWRFAEDSRLAVYYHATPLPGGDGALYLSRISRRGIRALYDLRFQLLKLTLYLAVLGVAAGMVVGWRFVRPLVRVQHRIRAYLRDPTRLDPAQLAVARRDEIGDLSRDFGELVGRIQERMRQTADVAADLAHDLKSPIATVSAAADLLGSPRAMDPDRQARLAAALGTAGAHMTRSVDGLLRLSRIEQALAAGPRLPVDLRALLLTLAESYRRDPATAHVSLDLELAAEVTVFGIEDQLRQLARNLLDNAAAFCNGKIGVELRCEAGHAVLQIDDDGPGVSAGNRDKLFRRFFSARKEASASGTGLGLAIARAIARAHGGDVRLAPTGRLPGASFVVELPLAAL